MREMEAIRFGRRELLEADNLATAFGAFARTFFSFVVTDRCNRLAFADFFSGGRPRPRFFKCFAKMCL